MPGEKTKPLIARDGMKSDERSCRMLTSVLMDDLHKSTEPETNDRITKYKIFQDYYNGTQWRNIERDEGRRKVTRNLCKRIVDVKADLLSRDPLITARRESEFSPVSDTGASDIQLKEESDKTDVIEKVLKYKILKQTSFGMAHEEFSQHASKFGLGVRFWWYDSASGHPRCSTLFPGFFRAEYKNDQYRSLLYWFYSMPMNVRFAEKAFGVKVVPDKDSAWKTFQQTAEYSYVRDTTKSTLAIHYYGPAMINLPGISKDEFIHAIILNGQVRMYEKDEDALERVSLYHNDWQPAERWGHSDLRPMVNTKTDGSLSLQDNYNMVNSDELDIINLYAWPRIVIATDGKVQQGDLQAENSRIIVVPQDARVSLLQFQGQVYQLEAHKNGLLDDIARETAIPKSALGVPDTSIITGAGISAEYEPLIGQARRRWEKAIAPMMEKEFRFALSLMRKYGGKEPSTGKKYSEILPEPEKIFIHVEPDIKAPRDEMARINQLTLQVREKLMSRTTAIEKLGYVDSADDEMTMISKELLNPFYNPELAMKIAEQIRRAEGVDHVDVEQEKMDAMDENMDMLRGTPVAVSETALGALLIHKAIHEEFMNMAQFKYAKKGVKEVFARHIRETAKKISEAQSKPKTPAAPTPEGMGMSGTEGMMPTGAPMVPAGQGGMEGRAGQIPALPGSAEVNQPEEQPLGTPGSPPQLNV